MSLVEEPLGQVKAVTVWKRGGQRAPHKPLLLLLSLASVQRGEDRLTPYREIEERLKRLLLDFGPPARKSIHPEYPFWRLQNDGDFWEVPQRDAALAERGSRKRTGDVPPRVLRSVQATGGFASQLHDHLQQNPDRVDALATQILNAHFPVSLHESILDAVEMPWVPATGRPRSSGFRDRILSVYDYRCAVCGFDGRLGLGDLGLEAAHLKWHAAGGPDTDANGIAMCLFHHRMLDRGALGLDPDRRVTISSHVNGGKQVHEILIRFCGRELRQPQPGIDPPGTRYIAWHTREVFRAPARQAG